MVECGCLDENEEIITEKLSQAFWDNRIDPQVLCSALGRQGLDEKFFK
jgi:hypothetical protein